MSLLVRTIDVSNVERNYLQERQMILDVLAKLMQFESMNQILEIFSEKIINNLIHSHYFIDEEEKKIVVNHSLDSLNRLINTVSSCRLIA